MKLVQKQLLIVAYAVAMLFLAQAHGEATSASTVQRTISTEEKTFGKEGDPRKATRTINIDMSDRMRFTPALLTVKSGDTVRFVIRNSGKAMHEMVLGTVKELTEHAELMRRFPSMEHDEPYMTHVSPGRTGQMVWQFTRPGEFYFGCLVPGHFEAGMSGKIVVK